MTVVLLAPVLLQAAASLPSAPPAPPAPPSPAARLSFPVFQGPVAAEERFQIDFRLRSSEGVLAEETVSIGTRTGANWQKSVTEPADDSCRDVQLIQPNRREINVSLTPARSTAPGGRPDTNGIMYVIVRWTRPVRGQCNAVRIVETRGAVQLVPGRAATIEGDGGLVAEFRRR
ncbi:hypothetical protein JW805_08140 [Roseomonas aeriglobus]|nr:hypothetical protein [Roseomonas aeriglobus]